MAGHVGEEAAASTTAAADPRERNCELAAESAGDATRSGPAAAEPASGSPAQTQVSTLDAGRYELEEFFARAVFYYEDRAAYFDLVRRWIVFANIVLGASTVANAAAKWQTWIGIAIGLLLTAINAADYAFDVTVQARLASELRRRYLDLASRLMNAKTDDAVAEVRSDWVRLAADEPSRHGAAEALARNKAIEALGRDRAALAYIPNAHKFLRHIRRYRGEEYA